MASKATNRLLKFGVERLFRNARNPISRSRTRLMCVSSLHCSTAQCSKVESNLEHEEQTKSDNDKIAINQQNALTDNVESRISVVSEQTVTVPLADSEITFETGKLARLADGSVVVRVGNTSVMSTVVGKELPSKEKSFVALTVDYRMKYAAMGKIPTNYFRRELGPSDNEILTSRLIDRSIRPLFPNYFPFETQVTCNPLSTDGRIDPDVVSINAASAALALSPLPWTGPVGAVRIGMLDDKIVVNPTRHQLQQSSINLIIAGNNGPEYIKSNSIGICMVEMEGKNIPPQVMQKCIQAAVTPILVINGAIEELREKCGKPKLVPPQKVSLISEAARDLVKTIATGPITKIFRNSKFDKLSRDKAVQQERVRVREMLIEQDDSIPFNEIDEAFNDLIKQTFRNLILEHSIRVDGRNLNDLRPIKCEVDLEKPLHGSAMFQRGQTQVLSTVTLDSLEAAFRTDPVALMGGAVREKKFMHHYEFPSFANNELGIGAKKKRRELGHGALAEKALKCSVPTDYPFTIRLNSEVLESNGSSSMASVCAGSMALMDAGVNVSHPTAGVAMGLVSDYQKGRKGGGKDFVAVFLTDILGIEDYLGDMDLKVAGGSGISACQLDLKIPGLPIPDFFNALILAQKARKEILKKMRVAIPQPRKERKANGPVSKTLELPPQKRVKLVGQGGYNIKHIQSETGVQITAIEESKFRIFAHNPLTMTEAEEMINNLLNKGEEIELEYGGTYPMKIHEIQNNGVLVTAEGVGHPMFIPLSQLDTRKVGHPEALGMEIGHSINVKCFGRDPNTGYYRLSRKALQISAPVFALKTKEQEETKKPQKKFDGIWS